jgi:hypothetical protein
MVTMQDQLPTPVRKSKTGINKEFTINLSPTGVEGKDQDIPIYKASFLSVISYSWFTPLMKKGFKEPLRVRIITISVTDAPAKRHMACC